MFGGVLPQLFGPVLVLCCSSRILLFLVVLSLQIGLSVSRNSPFASPVHRMGQRNSTAALLTEARRLLVEGTAIAQTWHGMVERRIATMYAQRDSHHHELNRLLAQGFHQIGVPAQPVLGPAQQARVHELRASLRRLLQRSIDVRWYATSSRNSLPMHSAKRRHEHRRPLSISSP